MDLLSKVFKASLLVFVLLFSTYRSDAQFFEFDRDQDIPVTVDGETLANAWAGGLTAAQVSRVDIDQDGVLDLFLFDRDGNRPLVFINEDASAGATSYRYAPEYRTIFPELRDWALMRDFDCDGKADIFTSSQSGIKVYRNTSTDDGPSFELHTPQIQAVFDFGNGPNTFPLVCLSIDIPSIIDYDGDGDLDIVTFTESATTLYFFKNMAVENGDCSTFDFICTNRCYGMVAEGAEDNSVFIGEDFTCPFNVAEPRKLEGFDEVTGGPRHAGGTVASIDLDQNGILDLVVGDSGYSSLQGWMMEDAEDGQDSTAMADLNFPSIVAGNEPVDLYRFPAAYYEDLDNDGVNDLLVAPNSRFQAEDAAGMWYYKNEGANDAPDFVFQKSDFLQEEMIDVGNGAYPVLFDYNSDGLLDLVVANKEYFIDVDERRSQLALFENTGTASDPAFTLIDDNWLDLPSLGLLAVYPAFGDLDGDGDADLILGEETGRLHYFENTAGAGEVAAFTLAEAALTDAANETIDVGQFSTPQLFDLDNDGLLDLLVGEKLGSVNYFRNEGSADAFAFSQVQGAAGDSLGGVAVNTFLGINGYSVPQMYRNESGDLYLFVSNETGTVELYNGINDNLGGLFNLVTDQLGQIREGYRAGIAVGDVTGDGVPDLFYGIANGGVQFYRGNGEVSVPDTEAASAIRLYPNPARDYLTIEFPQAFTGLLSIYDLAGRMQFQTSISASHRQVVSLNQLSAGTYLVEVQNAQMRFTEQVIVLER